MDACRVPIVFTTSRAMVEISRLATRPVRQTFWRIIQVVWYRHHSNTSQRYSYTILCECSIISHFCCFVSLNCAIFSSNEFLFFRLQMFFQNPSNIYLILSIIQSVIVILQVIILFMVVEWHNIISLSYLVLANYHTLFRIVRDFFVTHRMYSSSKSQRS